MSVPSFPLASTVSGINAAQARIQGLEKDLHMKGQDFNVALQIFFIPYLLFEIPSNILLRRVAPSTWLSGLMAGWGILSHSASKKGAVTDWKSGVTTACIGVTQSYAGLVVCRVLLGIFEAGFLPGKSKFLIAASLN